MAEEDRISVSYGRTINMGAYESTRIDASFETSVDTANKDDLESAFYFVKTFVEQKEKEIREGKFKRRS
jgi:hypothetical protein